MQPYLPFSRYDTEFYDQAVESFRSLPIQKQYELVCEVFGKQKVVLEVDEDGFIKIFRRPDNVDLVIYNSNPEDPNDAVRRCSTCGEHKYKTPVKILCGYSDCGYLCDFCTKRCELCGGAYCKSHLLNHMITKH